MNTRFTAILTTIATVGIAAHPSTLAGDREWAIAGKVLTGIAAAHVISRAFDPGPRVVYQYAPAPVVYQTVTPAPVVVHAAPVAPLAQVYLSPSPTYTVAPTTAVVYQNPPQVVYIAAPVYLSPPPVVHPYGHHFHPRRCFSRW